MIEICGLIIAVIIIIYVGKNIYNRTHCYSKCIEYMDEVLNMFYGEKNNEIKKIVLTNPYVINFLFLGVQNIVTFFNPSLKNNPSKILMETINIIYIYFKEVCNHEELKVILKSFQDKSLHSITEQSTKDFTYFMKILKEQGGFQAKPSEDFIKEVEKLKKIKDSNMFIQKDIDLECEKV